VNVIDIYKTRINSFNKKYEVKFPVIFYLLLMTASVITIVLYFAISLERKNHVRSSLYSIGITGEFKQWGQDITDFVDPMRFTRSRCFSRHVFSDEGGGHNLWYLRKTTGEGHATPLDFTTREVARESFLKSSEFTPLLVQIAFRTLNLFRARGW